MFILQSPKKCDSSLIERFNKYLTEKNCYYNVVSGKGEPATQCQCASFEEAKQVSENFINTDFSRIGTRRGQPIGYHFAASINHQAHQAILGEYITEWNDKKEVIYQLKTICELVTAEFNSINSLLVPFYIEAQNDGHFKFEIVCYENLTLIRKL